MVTLQTRANEVWRTDPERRKKAAELCTYRAVNLRKLIKALKEAQELGYLLYHSGFTNVPSLAVQIENLERSLMHFSVPTETLIGNMAAFGEGAE